MGDDATHCNNTPRTTQPIANDEAFNAKEAPPLVPSEEESVDTRVVVVTLESCDQQRFQLPWKAARHCGMIRNAVCKDDDEEKDEEDKAAVSVVQQPMVPLEKVTGSTLAKVVEFLNHLEQEPLQSILHPSPGMTCDDVCTAAVVMLDRKAFGNRKRRTLWKGMK